MCRQLGFLGTGARAYRYAHFGRGSGPIVLDNVTCTGLEAYITDCPNNGLYIHNCGHYEDAGVSCVGKCVYIRPVRIFHCGRGSLSYPLRISFIHQCIEVQ